MKTFFTSDLHLGHARVIEYSQRPFQNIEEHDEALIANWNRVVRPQDNLYFLGDLSFWPPRQAKELIARLNGRKHWIRGNHDHDGLVSACKEHFVWVRDLEKVRVADPSAPQGWRHIVLCHYAMRVWTLRHHGAWHLYGHSHGSLPDDPESLSFDVGVDCHGYAPVEYETVKQIMARKTQDKACQEEASQDEVCQEEACLKTGETP